MILSFIIGFVMGILATVTLFCVAYKKEEGIWPWQDSFPQAPPMPPSSPNPTNWNPAILHEVEITYSGVMNLQDPVPGQQNSFLLEIQPSGYNPYLSLPLQEKQKEEKEKEPGAKNTNRFKRINLE